MNPYKDPKKSGPRLPQWLKGAPEYGPNFTEVRSLVKTHALHTVCEEARCPNIRECWNQRTATFMILGEICTRSCGFCSVITGRPEGLDREEPARVAEGVRKLGLRHAVITSVNRDELPDGGAAIFARTIEAIRRLNPGCTVEVLVPDFKGDPEAVRTVLTAGPEIFGHNTETVPRLYAAVRPQAKYSRTLEVLRMAAAWKRARVKTGLMLGLGETLDEVREAMGDLRAAGVEMLTLGQYLQPTRDHLPVSRYLPPEEFDALREEGLALGFLRVESGPRVRSSNNAEKQASGQGVTDKVKSLDGKLFKSFKWDLQSRRDII
ncbi:MAG: lipoyl synthase [Nitrospirae bacterium]|nr:lipoyl synthase [Nitrospirota bacterium]